MPTTRQATAPGQPWLVVRGPDTDGDGIPDAKEFLAGTHPLIASDGDPWLLFRANFHRNLPQIALTLAATIVGLWGLGHLLRGFAAATPFKNEDSEESAP